MTRFRTSLVIGDLIALAIVTIVGFGVHGELDVSMIPRMFTTFLPMAVSWLFIAPWLNVFEEKISGDWRKLWRLPAAGIISTPLAATMRAVILNSVLAPLFIIILAITTSIGILLWRILFIKLFCKT